MDVLIVHEQVQSCLLLKLSPPPATLLATTGSLLERQRAARAPMIARCRHHLPCIYIIQQTKSILSILLFRDALNLRIYNLQECVEFDLISLKSLTDVCRMRSEERVLRFPCTGLKSVDYFSRRPVPGI